MPDQQLRIVIAGGGTGGHIQPAIAVSSELRRTADAELFWIGSRNGLERDVARANGISYSTIPTGKLRRYASLHTVLDAARIPFGIMQARWHLRNLQPDVVFSTGGFVSVPTVIAGWLAGIPILTHEQTATVGLANRINARFATRIALAFESTRTQLSGDESRVVVTGNPVRSELLNGDRQRAYDEFGFDSSLPLVYVTGGSLGAQAVNNTVRTLISGLVTTTNVLHQCGPSSANGDYPRLLHARDDLPENVRNRYMVREGIGSELADVYAAADLVVGRAGAGTITELALLGKPSILIPLPGAAANEQQQNAQVLERAGAAMILPQTELTPDRLLREIRSLLDDDEKRQSMADAARSVA